MEGTIIRGCDWCKCSVGGGGISTLDTLKPPCVGGVLRFVGNGCGPGGGWEVGCI